MKRLVFIGLLVFIGSIGIYLVWPSPKFPEPPPGSLQSSEPADTESIYRRSYYTNLNRFEIMAYYDQQFKGWIQYRLNHPPEDAQTMIRNLTMTSYLEEIVHPGRESWFINGFVPVKDVDQIKMNGVVYPTKIIVRYVPSYWVARITVLLAVTALMYWMYKEYAQL